MAKVKEFYKYDDKQMNFHYSLDEHPDLLDERFKMHTHQFNELYYCISGKGTFSIEGTRYKVRGGDLLIMKSAESHAIEISAGEPYERLALQFDPQLLEDAGLSDLLIPFNSRELGKGNLFRASDFKNSLYRTLLEGLTDKKPNPKTQIISMLIPLLNEIKTAYDERGRVDTGADEDLCWRITDYINCHLSSELSLESLCKRFYISKSQLCRLFKASLGSGVWEYITVKRLITAKSLIKSGVHSTKAAVACGFNDYSAFYRAYTKYFGTSPKKDI